MADAITDETSRRDFLYVATAGVAGVGIAMAAWPIIDQMNPSADVRALATSEVDISQIEVGQSVTVKWQGKPVFIRRRTEDEIKSAEDVPMAELKDPEADADRREKAEWLIMIGVCTHLGCVPLGQQGDFGGWFCPCHGSHYDTSGRIRLGPAPKNLEIPPYDFVSDSVILIG